MAGSPSKSLDEKYSDGLTIVVNSSSGVELEEAQVSPL
jgi:hypothetical protein